ncbi:hypothetical protein HDF25_002270 [Pedobacter cryoconitis]|uniref:Uncharacterized protein n=1 Tax=Pedobacter cryoconitis TaxID=188932 RepID=A0A7X0J5Q9_9SPHI|nr:hypothetical protein [Pedobacter cryoconitis]
MKNNIEKIVDSDNPYVRAIFLAFVFFIILIPIYNIGKSDGAKVLISSELKR